MASGGQTVLQFPQASTNLTAKIHPLVIYNICDCFVRRPDQAERVIGTLRGSVLPDGTVDTRNSYAIPHSESSDQIIQTMAAAQSSIQYLGWYRSILSELISMAAARDLNSMPDCDAEEPRIRVRNRGVQDHLQSKMKHAVAGQGGSNGGRISGIGGEGNGGTGSNASPYLQGGGAAVVPIYNAGAGANMHRNNHHHNAGSSVQSFRGSPAIAAILLAHLLRDMYI